MKNRYVYPAFFCYSKNQEIGVVFPDLAGGVSQGASEEEALRMAREALSLHLFSIGKRWGGNSCANSSKRTFSRKRPGHSACGCFMPPFRKEMNAQKLN